MIDDIFEMFTEFWDDGILGKIITVSAFSLIPLLVAAIYFTIQESKAWDVFQAAHHCRIVGEVSGSTFVTAGIGANRQITTGIGTTSGKTGYACDDGVTYWR